VSTAACWGVSSLDWRSQAIDEDADHPYGVYVARCGQRVFMGASLYDEAPGWMCLACLRQTEQWNTGEVTEPPPARPEPEERRGGVSRPGRWARSPLDYHAHLLLLEGDHPPGVLKTRCGDLMMTNATRHDQRPPGLTCQRCVFLADSPRDE